MMGVVGSSMKSTSSPFSFPSGSSASRILPNQLGEIDPLCLDRDLSGFDSVEVEKIVDQIELDSGVVVNSLRHLLPFRNVLTHARLS